MASFTVHAQIRLEAEDVQGTHRLVRTLSTASIAHFKSLDVAERCGVFVFALRGQGGAVTPWYVGLAKRQSFADEAISQDKLRKYAKAMFGRTGTPLLTLVLAPRTGPRDPIDDLETLLIWMGQSRNPSLLNERKVDSGPATVIELVNRISIAGVLNARTGRTSAAARAFKSMMGLED